MTKSEAIARIRAAGVNVWTPGPNRARIYADMGTGGSYLTLQPGPVKGTWVVALGAKSSWRHLDHITPVAEAALAAEVSA
jgi:hypothetical protein